MKNANRPAYPTRLCEGFTKLEAAALAVLPCIIAQDSEQAVEMDIHNAFDIAEQFCAEAEKRQPQ